MTRLILIAVASVLVLVGCAMFAARHNATHQFAPADNSENRP